MPGTERRVSRCPPESRGRRVGYDSWVNVTLEDGALRLTVARVGAEMQSLRRADSPVEYLWQGDPASWGRSAPHLFPVVGRLKRDTFVHQGKAYTLGQHGFARDREFAVEGRTATGATFVLHDDADTLAIYPFRFRLAVAYRLAGGTVEITYGVENAGGEEMPFSIGAHPGFRCPLSGSERFEEYVVEFERAETARRYPVEDGLVSRRGEPFLSGESAIPLGTRTFERGALVFKELTSRRARLVGRQSGHGVDLTFAGFPFFALWGRPGAPFVCLEPWCGVADAPDASGRLEDKEGVVRLPPGRTFTRTLTIRPF
jgi:galactose mutarotase-like enzyme